MLQITRLAVLRFGAALVAVWLAAASSGAPAYDGRARFDQSALDAMIAPIALYPDQLLTQVLMAATYPQEVAEAARWSRARPGMSGDAAVRVAAGWDWDPSVRSLTAFPDVLDTMARHMAWTEDLGQAFIVQPQDVMDTVQRLRFRAHEAGTLASSEYTQVTNTGSGLVIESVQPQVVYIPYYDTRVVYGPWWWPARPPMYWPRWHGYHDVPGRPRVVHWGPGTSLGAGFFFGGFDWSRREVRVVNTRTYYYAPREFAHRPAHVHPAPQNIGAHVWRHDGTRRGPRQGQPAERVTETQQRSPQAQGTGAFAPREAQPQTDGSQTRFDRRAQRGRDSDGVPVTSTPARAGVNPTPQQAAERPVQRTPQLRQEAPAATGALAPRAPQPQADESESRFDRRTRRSRDSDGDGDTRASAPIRPSVSPAPQQTVSPAPQEAPRANVEERRRKAAGRDKD